MLEIIPKSNKRTILITRDVFKTKREILKTNNAKIFNKINVLNFDSLLKFIYKKEFGKPVSNLKKLTNIERIIFMNLAFKNSKNDLFIYKNDSNIIELIIEFQKKIKDNFIELDDFKNLKTENWFLMKKIKDLCLIIKNFEELISEKYFDPLDNLKKLYNLLIETSFLKNYEIIVDSSCFFTHKEKKILEILKEKSKKFYVTNKKKNKNIKSKIIKAKDIYEECELICSVIQQNYHKLKDIAIIVRNEENYKEILASLLKISKIPYNFGTQKFILDESISKFILSFFEIFLSNFSSKSVLKYVKTDLTNLTQDQIIDLENYVRKWEIECEDWLLEFNKHPMDSKEQFKDEKLIKINKIRKILINPLLNSYKDLKNSSTSKEISYVLWKFLEDLKVFKKENIKTINEIIKVLNSISESLEKEKITIKNYYKILKLSFKKIKIKNKKSDCLEILTTKNALNCNFNTVFIMGVIDSEFPKNPSQNKIFSVKEYENLIKNNIDLKDSIEENFAYEKFLFQNALTLGKENTYISFYKKDLEGKEKFPYKIVNEKAEFLKIKRREIVPKKIKKNNIHSEKLFSFPLLLSSTQIEGYNTCSFKYFCKYALKIKDNKPFDFGALEYGNCAHYLMEKIFSKYRPEELLYENIFDIIEKVLKDYIFSKSTSNFFYSHRFNFLFFRMKKFMSTVIFWVRNELLASDFGPLGYEISILKNQNNNLFEALKIIENGKILAFVEGKIDRLDTMKKNNKNYFRVIDYKISRKKFDLSSILFGLDMQMLVYTSIIRENSKDSILAGMFYLGLCTPITNNKTNIIKNMKMNGIVLNDALAILGMEKEAKGKIINAKMKNGKISGPCILNSEDIDVVVNFVKKKILETTKNITSKEFKKNPIKKDKYLACEFCEYKNICCHKDHENNRILVKIDKDEILKKIKSHKFNFI